jgi:hypothetical protein
VLINVIRLKNFYLLSAGRGTEISLSLSPVFYVDASANSLSEFFKFSGYLAYFADVRELADLIGDNAY